MHPIRCGNVVDDVNFEKIKGEIDLSTCLSVRLSNANSEISDGLVFELETKNRWWGLVATTDIDMQNMQNV